jgi:pimeloyl-ACP methyl ester carboxylesterase
MEELYSHPYFAPIRSSGQMTMWAVLARFGFFRMIGRKMLPEPYQEKLPAYPVAIMITPRYFRMDAIEDEVSSDNDVRKTDGFDDTPLIVIVHSIADPLIFGRLQGEDLEKAKVMFQNAARNLADLSTNSQYVVAEGSGHLVIIERPDVVIDAILSLVVSK